MPELPEDYLRRLLVRLAPEQIRAMLAYAGLVLIEYEMVKEAVVEALHERYCRGSDETGMPCDEARYDRDVRSLDKNRFKASVKWLVKNGAITDEQAKVLDRLYAHRKDMAHELADYMIDVDRHPDLGLFAEALEVLTALHRFWAQVDIDAGVLDAYGDITVDDLLPLDLSFLKLFIRAFAEGLPARDAPPGSQSMTVGHTWY
jgi:hypothetical protein